MVQNECGISELKFKPIRINKKGQIVEELTENVSHVSEVQEKDNNLWLGYVVFSYVRVLH